MKEGRCTRKWDEGAHLANGARNPSFSSGLHLRGPPQYGLSSRRRDPSRFVPKACVDRRPSLFSISTQRVLDFAEFSRESLANLLLEVFATSRLTSLSPSCILQHIEGRGMHGIFASVESGHDCRVLRAAQREDSSGSLRIERITF